MSKAHPVFYGAQRKIAILLMLAICGLTPTLGKADQSTSQAGPFNEMQTELTALPGSIHQVNNKFPENVPLILWKKNCHPDSVTPAQFAQTADTHYEVTVAAAGVTTSTAVTATACQLTTQLKLEASELTAGYYIISVIKKTKDKPDEFAGHATLAILDATAGAIPGNAAVDTFWSVLSDEMCGRNFGKRVSRAVYCVEVKLGNNTGHSMQLAGIGFRRHVAGVPDDTNANLSYRSVRGAAEAMDSTLSSRNFYLHGAQALGILMGSFNPFFRSAQNVARWAAGTAVVGTGLPGAISHVWPDLSQTQLNNLDDEAFRDGILIPNNTQIRTTVFVDKTLVAGSGHKYYADACRLLFRDANDKTGTDDPMADQGKCLKSDNDPTVVKMALGNIVVVGDEIDFIQRVVVDKQALANDQAATTQGPKIFSITPTPATVTAMVDRSVDFADTVLAVGEKDSTPITLTLDKSKPAGSELVYTAPTNHQLKTGSTYTFTFKLKNGKDAESITQSVTAPAATPEDTKQKE